MEGSRLNFERQYAESIENLLKNGIRKTNRTGIDTISIEHQYFHIQNINDNFPRIKGKMVYPKLALKELIWMLKGRTDAEWLNKHNVHYWDEWMKPNKDGQLTIGKSYGYQYRDFNGIDQVKQAIDDMLNNPESRRIIINLWNQADLKDMTLPPCMYDYHFSLVPINNVQYKVNLHAHIRSNDSFLGCPYDVMFCAWFIYIICKYLNRIVCENKYIPNDIHYTADDYHLYTNHIEQAEQYLKNVEENKFGIIDSNCKIFDDIKFAENEFRIINSKGERIGSVIFDKNLYINNYLDLIEENFDKLKATNDIDFKYPKIQANVAV